MGRNEQILGFIKLAERIRLCRRHHNGKEHLENVKDLNQSLNKTQGLERRRNKNSWQDVPLSVHTAVKMRCVSSYRAESHYHRWMCAPHTPKENQGLPVKDGKHIR